MIFAGKSFNYDSNPYFVDRSLTMALKTEKYDIWRRKQVEKYFDIQKTLKPGETIKPLNPVILKVLDTPEPYDPRKAYVWDKSINYNDVYDKIDTSKNHQPFDRICGEMFDFYFSKMVGSQRFEDDMGDSLGKVEVLKLTKSETAKALHEKKKAANDRELNLKKNISQATKGEKFKKELSTLEKLKSMSEDEWIMCILRLFKTIPLLISAIDLDVKRIAYNSGRYNAMHVTTITQMETILQLNDKKEMLLNMYVLNKLLAGLCLTYEERMVFLCVMQRSMGSDKITSQKLRTAYRTRRRLLRRFREFLLKRGYDAGWFYDHFSFLPCVHYYILNHKEGEDKRLKELNMDAQEYKNNGVDVLDFLGDDANVEGDPVYNEHPEILKKMRKQERQTKNLKLKKAGVNPVLAKRNEARNFAYRFNAAREFDGFMNKLPKERREELLDILGSRTTESVLKRCAEQAEDYRASEM